MGERRTSAGAEAGFTLIELLVVIVIIGVLAAIAVPVFLKQRERAYDGAAQSDLRNMATAQETYLSEYDSYTTNVTDLEDQGFRKSVAVTGALAITTGAQEFCLQLTSGSGTQFVLTSQDPVARAGAC